VTVARRVVAALVVGAGIVGVVAGTRLYALFTGG
jgi:hypothetical protein